MKKFVKVLEGDCSNASGYQYKIGEINVADNWNPKAKDPKEYGGFNFSSEDKIFRWLLRGDTLYDVEIPIDAEVLEVENTSSPHGVFRTNKIIISNPRRLDPDLVMDLYRKSELPLKSYFQCLTFLAEDGYYDACKQIIIDKVNDKNVDEALKTFLSFFELTEADKTDTFKEVEDMLREIKDKELLNVCISREPLIKELTNDRVINITGQSGAGKTYYVREHFDNNDYLFIDTDDIFSEDRFERATGINRELGEMFREKYPELPTLSDDFDLIYNEILDYCSLLNKTIIIDCAQFHCVKDISVLKGKLIILRTDVSTCYKRTIDRYMTNHPDFTEDELNDYKERKKKIFRWYKGTNDFIKQVLKLK